MTKRNFGIPAALLLLSACGQLATHQDASDIDEGAIEQSGGDDRAIDPSVMDQKRSIMIPVKRPESVIGAVAIPKAIFLNREGRTYTAGDDDSVKGISSVVLEQKMQSATIPPLSWSDAKWEKFRACVVDEFARFNVKVTDQRPKPEEGPYIEASIGGWGSEIKLPFGVLGVAPVDVDNCRPIPTAIVYIFADNFFSGNEITNCETAAQEIGHSLIPLDHELLASDPLTYLNYSGHKTFQDNDAECGEDRPRECMCKTKTQNTVQRIYKIIGKAGSCSPSCDGKSCGDDGCGGSCGTCGGDSTCNGQGQCVPAGGCNATGGNEVEPNGKFATANALCASGSTKGKITPKGDIDTYRFGLTAGNKYKIVLSDLPADYGLALYQKNSKGQMVKLETAKRNGVKDRVITRTTDSGGEYYLKVLGSSGANNPDKAYSLTLTVQ